MKNLSIAFFATFLMLMSSCKKDSSSTPATTPAPPATANPYFFKFSMYGINTDFTANFPEYMYLFTNEVGGYQEVGAFTDPTIGLSFVWPSGYTIKDSDVLNLAGKTFYFSDTAINPQLEYDQTATSNSFFSTDTSNTNYYVKVTSVTFLKDDTALGYYPLRTYVITGSCNAVMNNGDSTTVLSAGSFNFIISRDNF